MLVNLILQRQEIKEKKAKTAAFFHSPPAFPASLAASLLLWIIFRLFSFRGGEAVVMPAVAWWMLSFSLLGILSMEFPSHFDSIALHWRNSFFTGNWKSVCLPGALSHERRMLLMARSTLLLITWGGNVFLCAENRLSGRKLTLYHILSASMSLSATAYFTNSSILFFSSLMLRLKASLQKQKHFWRIPLIFAAEKMLLKSPDFYSPLFISFVCPLSYNAQTRSPFYTKKGLFINSNFFGKLILKCHFLKCCRLFHVHFKRANKCIFT